MAGDARGRVFTFPIPTYTQTTSFFVDGVAWEDVATVSSKETGDPLVITTKETARGPGNASDLAVL